MKLEKARLASDATNASWAGEGREESGLGNEMGRDPYGGPWGLTRRAKGMTAPSSQNKEGGEIFKEVGGASMVNPDPARR